MSNKGNSNFINESNTSKSSPYSSFYQVQDGLKEEESSIKSDPFKRENTNVIESKYAPQMNNPSTTSYKSGYDTTQTISQIKKYPYSSNLHSERIEIRNEFLEKAKNDFNILPSEYRDRLKRVNSLFVISSVAYPLYFLVHIFKDYPDLSYISRRKIILSTTLFIGFFLIYNNYTNTQCEKAYDLLRIQYSPDEIKNMISQYHDVNAVNVTNTQENRGI